MARELGASQQTVLKSVQRDDEGILACAFLRAALADYVGPGVTTRDVQTDN